MPKLAAVVAAGIACLLVAACGRQVSPNPPGVGALGSSTGFMTVKFDVAANFNFSNYEYWIVFNTSGNGLTPLTNPAQNNWQAYTNAIEVTGSGVSVHTNPYEFIKQGGPITPQFQYLNGIASQDLIPIYNSNGTGTEFSVSLLRSIFATPQVQPKSNIWKFNAFVTQAAPLGDLLFLDSMGSGGATDQSFSSPNIDVDQCLDVYVPKLQDINPPSDPAAQIVSVEIGNNPSPGPSSAPCN